MTNYNEKTSYYHLRIKSAEQVKEQFFMLLNYQLSVVHWYFWFYFRKKFFGKQIY